MAVTVFEISGLARTDEDDRSSVVRTYRVHGTGDDDVARNAVHAEAPPDYRNLLRTGITVTELGPDEWLGEATYTHRDNQQKRQPPGHRSSSTPVILSFSATGQQQHITHGRGVFGNPHRNPLHPELASELFGAINVRHTDGEAPEVDGVDIIVPTLTFTVQHVIPLRLFSFQWVRKVSDFIGTVNKQRFAAFEEKEVLFTGLAANQNGEGDFDIEYQLAVSPRKENLEVGPIKIPIKNGWEYVSVVTRPVLHPEQNPKTVIPMVVQADVIEVYEESNYPVELGFVGVEAGVK